MASVVISSSVCATLSNIFKNKKLKVMLILYCQFFLPQTMKKRIKLLLSLSTAEMQIYFGIIWACTWSIVYPLNIKYNKIIFFIIYFNSYFTCLWPILNHNFTISFIYFSHNFSNFLYKMINFKFISIFFCRI